MDRTYKRIIISRTDKIGDLVLSIPSFYMVRKMYPEAEIIVLVRNYNYDIVKNLPYIDRIVKIDDYRQKELIEKIEYFKADVFIALYVDKFVLKLARASRAKIKIGPYSKLGSFFTFNKGVLQKRSKSIKHEAEYNLDLVRKLDKKRFDECYELNTKIYLGENNIKAADRFFKENKIDGKILVVNPFMGGSAKNITDAQYALVLKKVKKRVKDLNIIITCHISDEERGEKLISLIDEEKVFLYANGGELLNIAAVIDKADLYFGGSTGPTHLAASLQKKIVALYPNKPTQSPTRWGIFGNEKVEYVIPDKDKKENYESKIFECYNEEIENELVEKITKELGE